MIQLPGVECRERERNVPRLDCCCCCSIYIVVVVEVIVIVGGRFGETTIPPKMIRVVRVNEFKNNVSKYLLTEILQRLLVPNYSIRLKITTVTDVHFSTFLILSLFFHLCLSSSLFVSLSLHLYLCHSYLSLFFSVSVSFDLCPF